MSTQSLRHTALALILWSAALPSRLFGQCDLETPSLDPEGTFQSPVNNYLQEILNLPGSRIETRTLTVNTPDLLQSFQVTFRTGGGATFFNRVPGAFPPARTADLPVAAFDPLGVLSFYRSAGDYTDAQLEGVQRLYASDLASRRNYGFNLANLARHLTALQQAGASRFLTNQALGRLRAAYDMLSDPTSPAPDPRRLYRQIAVTYRRLGAPDAKTLTGLNLLAAGASNDDTNRILVAAGEPTPTTQCPGCFPLPDFDTVRNTPLSAAQGNPAGVFGQDVDVFLRRLGIVGAAGINYQVNSADTLQFILVPLNPSSSLTVFFARGFPVGGAANVPEFAFLDGTGAGAYFDAAQPPTANQALLAAFYTNPANAGIRGRYYEGLHNQTCAFEAIADRGPLDAGLAAAVQDALDALAEGEALLEAGGLPDVFGLYQHVSRDVDALAAAAPSLNRAQRRMLKTLRGSLQPIGQINYYVVPIASGTQVSTVLVGLTQLAALQANAVDCVRQVTLDPWGFDIACEQTTPMCTITGVPGATCSHAAVSYPYTEWGLNRAGIFRYVDADSDGDTDIEYARTLSAHGYADLQLYPPDAQMMYRWADLVQIDLDILAVIGHDGSPGPGGGDTYCGLAFALGDVADGSVSTADGPARAPLMNISMQLAGRDWATQAVPKPPSSAFSSPNQPSQVPQPNDQFRVRYQARNTAGSADEMDMTLLDTWFSQASQPWGHVKWASGVGKPQPAFSNAQSIGDTDEWVVYHFRGVFDHVARTVTWVLTPLDRGVSDNFAAVPALPTANVSSWSQKSYVWEYSVQNDQPSGDENWAIDLAGTGLDWTGFGQRYVNIGFTAGGIPKRCVYMNMAIEHR